MGSTNQTPGPLPPGITGDIGTAQPGLSGADDAQSDFAYPQREAAFFYGLFLRGHSPEQLRRDISVPPDVLARWTREIERRPEARPVFDRIVEFRRHVLAIFDSLVTSDTRGQRLQ
jgi:hypothetical protein